MHLAVSNHYILAYDQRIKDISNALGTYSNENIFASFLFLKLYNNRK